MAIPQGMWSSTQLTTIAANTGAAIQSVGIPAGQLKGFHVINLVKAPLTLVDDAGRLVAVIPSRGWAKGEIVTKSEFLYLVFNPAASGTVGAITQTTDWQTYINVFREKLEPAMGGGL